jgi:hypothetical protein
MGHQRRLLIETPADVMRIDETAQDSGLIKGNLSDNEKKCVDFSGLALKRLDEKARRHFSGLSRWTRHGPNRIPGWKDLMCPAWLRSKPLG